jgi:SAM-dependent methyltransferase
VTPWPYDVTAEFYDLDMGLNAPAGSVAWYLAEATRAVVEVGGPVLELGCGTGRITLPLAASGLEVLAIDKSLPMLRVLQRRVAAAGLAERVHSAAMDMAKPGLGRRFAAVLCPYSAFGYLIDDGQRARMLAGVQAALAEGGVLLLDMFVPDPDVEARAADVLLPDYQRSLPPGPWGPAVSLARSKGLRPGTQPGLHHVVRHYRFLDAAGATLRELRTDSMQRSWRPADLVPLLEAAGFELLRACGDFCEGMPAEAPARTAAFVARPVAT